MGNSESKKDKNTIIRHSLVGTSNGQNARRSGNSDGPWRKRRRKIKIESE